MSLYLHDELVPLVEAEVQDVQVDCGPQVVNVGDEAKVFTLHTTPVWLGEN